VQNPIQYAACPNCRQNNAIRVSSTWWGGIIGPAMFTHVKCLDCGTQYNGKTGKPNQKSIIVYLVASLFLTFFMFVFISYLVNNT
jgi:hypothetical protein